jgi:hypothetical protein
MHDQEKAEFVARSKASLDSCRSGGKNDVAKHVAPVGIATHYGEQARWGSSETQSPVPPKKIGLNFTEHDIGLAESTSKARGIDWRSPASMFGTSFVGLLAALGQHLYYSSLAGDLVGTTDQQQLVLRWVLPYSHPKAMDERRLAGDIFTAATFRRFVHIGF